MDALICGERQKPALGSSHVLLFGYDAAGRQSLIQHRKSDGTVIERFDYTRDEAGNIITQQADRVANTIYTYFNYDAANRVSREAWRTSGGANVYGFDYVYDSAGNRQSKTNTIAANSVYWEYDLADQTTKQRSGAPVTVYFEFDNNGNVSVEHDVDGSAGRTYYDYDARNLLTRVDFPGATATNYFYYNALSERTRKDDSTAQKKYTWDGIDVVVEKDLSNSTTQRLIKGYTPIGGIGAYVMQQLGSSVIFGHKNQVGTTMRHTDGTQSVVNYYEYDAWGQPLEVHEATSQQYRAPSQKELDPDYILFNVNNRRVHFPFRDLGPFRGVFIQMDPILIQRMLLRGHAGPVFNDSYQYAEHGPTVQIDPRGGYSYDSGGNPGYKKAMQPVWEFLRQLIKSKDGAWYQKEILPYALGIGSRAELDKARLLNYAVFQDEYTWLSSSIVSVTGIAEPVIKPRSLIAGQYSFDSGRAIAVTEKGVGVFLNSDKFPWDYSIRKSALILLHEIGHWHWLNYGRQDLTHNSDFPDVQAYLMRVQCETPIWYSSRGWEPNEASSEGYWLVKKFFDSYVTEISTDERVEVVVQKGPDAGLHLFPKKHLLGQSFKDQFDY